MNEKSPIIFLNIDGVLISENYIMSLASKLDILYSRIGNRSIMNFEEDKINLLKKIIEKTNAYIVVSSSWNKDNTLDDIKNIFKKYDLDKRIIDITPYLCKKRGYEVQDWIDNNTDNFMFLDKDNFLILDDQKIGHLEEYHVKTNSKTGMTNNDCKKVLNKLLKL